jgi:chromosome segregation ATPase
MTDEDRRKLEAIQQTEHLRIVVESRAEAEEARSWARADIKMLEAELEKANSSVGIWYRREGRLRRELEKLNGWLGLLLRAPQRTSVTAIRTRFKSMRASIKAALEARD